MKTTLKTFEVSPNKEVLLRCATFIPRQNWIAVVADDNHLRIYNYNTMEKLDDVIVGIHLSRLTKTTSLSGLSMPIRPQTTS